MKARSGSEASRVIARTISRQLRIFLIGAGTPSFLDPLARVWGWTVGPVEVSAARLGDGAFVAREALDWGGTRDGYLRTVLLAVRAALEVEEPILEDMANLQYVITALECMKSLDLHIFVDA